MRAYAHAMNAMTNHPVDFTDSLVARCFPHKYRRIGTPFDYLDDIGIEAICEFICKGHLLIDVAEATNVPLATLNKWAVARGHLDHIHDAEKKSAEGFLAEGQKRLRLARTDFELKKAKEMIRSAQFMAEKKDRGTYGNQKEGKKAARTTYVFNIGAAPDPNTAKFAGRIIDASKNPAKHIDAAPVAPSKVQLRLPRTQAQPQSATPLQETASLEPIEALRDTDIPVTLGEAFAHLLDGPDEPSEAPGTVVDKPDDWHPEELPGSILPLTPDIPRPLIPTPDEPDIGPFYTPTQPNEPNK